MAKFATRLTIILVSIYFLIGLLLSYFCGIDIIYHSYILLFELCVVCYTFLNGKYHCRYIRWAALSIFSCDTINHLDFYLNFLEVDEHFYISIVILSLGLGTSTFMALHHFHKVGKIKRKREKLYGINNDGTKQ